MSDMLYVCRNRLDIDKISGHFKTIVVDDLPSISLMEVGDIVAFDPESGSESLMKELASRGIPKTKLSYVGSADINDVRHFMWNEVVPISQLDVGDDFDVYPCGIGFLEKNLNWNWRIPELAVLAGPYGCGKSTFGQIIAGEFVLGQAGKNLNSGALLCSWEDLAEEVVRNFGILAKDRGNPELTDIVHFVKRTASEDRLIGWFIELMEYHVYRYNTRFYFLDPWNEMDHIKDIRQSETDYVRDVMKMFRSVVDKLKVILVIATHVPAKVIRGDGTIEPFRIAQAFGSVQFANKADRGICLLRTKKIIPPTDMNGRLQGQIIEDEHGFAIIRLDKSKIERKMGKRGVVVGRFNPKKFGYDYSGDATKLVQPLWRD